MADAQLPAKPKRIPGLPNNFQLLTFDGFDGLNTKPTRAGLKDQQCGILDNWMPLGKSNLRTLYDVGGAIAHIDSTGQIQPGPVPVPSGSYTTGAVHFDGATTLNRAALGGAADSPFLSAVTWLKPTIPFSNFMGAGTYKYAFWSETAAFVQVDLHTASGTDVRVFFSLNGSGGELFSGNTVLVAAPTIWFPLMMSFDTNHAAGSKVANIYFGDVAQTIVVENDTDPAFNMGFAALVEVDTFGFDPTINYNGDASDDWVGLGQFVDFTVTANRRKFMNASGKPVDLGTDGSTPTGIAPTFFLRRAPAADPATYATDLSGNGNTYPITGALTAASTSPSD